MKQTVIGGTRCGSVKVPASKSQAHRQLICAALSEEPSVIFCEGMSKDIEATIKCLNGIGADITVSEDGKINVIPVKEITEELGHLYCGESGSTLRFLIPVVGALGKTSVFHMEGRLPSRPNGVFIDELMRHGMVIRQEDDLLYCSGKLEPGTYTIPGNISSQFISGLLMSLPKVDGDCVINITENIESLDYILMTEDAVKLSGITFEKGESDYKIKGGQKFKFPKEVNTESDWSNAAFYFCMGAASEKGIFLKGLNMESSQGDKRILEIVKAFGADITVSDDGVLIKKGDLKGQVIDASLIPDLVPTISSLAACAKGQTVICHAERLRIKESDRLLTTKNMLKALGADIEETEDGLIINGVSELKSGEICAENDHRIAMAAAVASCRCTGEVVVDEAECVSKSYPLFWEHFGHLEVER